MLLLTALAGVALGAAGGEQPPPFDTPLPGPPLAPPLDLTGGFCEYRIGHFHAGFDFGTGREVGRPVLAPADGWVERVRSSGVGYGRSIYLRTRDGRLLQFGHLDAFAEPLARLVREAQDSSGQYEQDLWPPAERFAYRTGDVIAWSGESGAGGPHLHFEIRRGDMAYHPGRAGLAVRDDAPPSIVSLTLEALDDTSSVAGRIGPVTRVLGERPDTIAVRGRVRAIVGARDGMWRGVDRMVPWSTAMTFEGRRTECRFDSVSWATDMAESDHVYDSGRVVGEKGVVLWAPAGFRPRVLVADAAPDQEAGTIVMRPGDPPRVLSLEARDLGGGVSERRVVLVALPVAAVGVAPAPAPGQGGAPIPLSASFASLPGGYLRVTLRGAPAGSRDVRVAVVSADTQVVSRAGREGDAWVAMLRVPGTPTTAGELLVTGEASGDRWEHVNRVALARTGETSRGVALAGGSWRLELAAGAAFEDATLCASAGEAGSLGGELRRIGEDWDVGPERTPLRRSVQVSVALPAGEPAERVAIYRRSDDGWDRVGGAYNPATRRVTTDTRRLGRFALLRDVLAPRVTLREPTAPRSRGPYSRWALEAEIVESGSGVDARASWFEVDGRRVPAEWDPEKRVLRWRPARPPAPGRHRVRVVTADRAGNVAQVAGSFR